MRGGKFMIKLVMVYESSNLIQDRLGADAVLAATIRICIRHSAVSVYPGPDA
jgi:hypothetical protein